MLGNAKLHYLKVGLPPIASADARLLILGSLPGDASLAAQRYYAHPTNQFWRLLGGAIGEDLQSQSYNERLGILAQRRIALWDVVSSAARRGSLDQSIRFAEHNALGDLLAVLPNLRAVGFNGQTAARIGRTLITVDDLELFDLPSSSAANTTPVADKAAAWAQLAQFV